MENKVFQIDKDTKAQYVHSDVWDVDILRFLTPKQIQFICDNAVKKTNWGERQEIIDVLLCQFLINDEEKLKSILSQNYEALVKAGLFQELKEIAAESVKDIKEAIAYQESFTRVLPMILDELKLYADKFEELKGKK